MDSALLLVLTNAGVAGVVIILMIGGWLVPRWIYKNLEKENKHLREALDLERQSRKEALNQGVTTTNQLIGALVNLAEKRHTGEQVALRSGSKESLCDGSGGLAGNGGSARRRHARRLRGPAGTWRKPASRQPLSRATGT